MISDAKIGDRVWLAYYAAHEVRATCPICYGTGAVTLILGNGDELRQECDYCAKGFGCPRGFVLEYEPGPAARQYMIDRVSVSATDVEYQADCTILRAENCYSTEAEALAAAVEIALKEKAVRESRADFAKHDAARSYSWNAGYHLRQVADLRKRAEYHERMASLCKASTGPSKASKVAP